MEQARTAQANAEKAAAEAQTRLAEGQKNLPWPDAAAMAAARAETQKQRRTLQAALDAAAKSRDAFSKELAAAQSAAQTLAEQAGIPPAARTLPPSSRPLLHCKLSAKPARPKTRPPCTGWIPTAMP